MIPYDWRYLINMESRQCTQFPICKYLVDNPVYDRKENNFPLRFHPVQCI